MTDVDKFINIFEGSHALQGNLDPKILLDEDAIIKETVFKLLSKFKNYLLYQLAFELNQRTSLNCHYLLIR